MRPSMPAALLTCCALQGGDTWSVFDNAQVGAATCLPACRFVGAAVALLPAALLRVALAACSACTASAHSLLPYYPLLRACRLSPNI